MCTYNAGTHIRAQVNSILNQSVSPGEIVVCDDGSTDDTRSILTELQKDNPTIKLFFNAANLGVTKNFEQSLQLCSGTIIFLSDQDDIWEPDKIETIVNYFNANPGKNVVFSNAALLVNGQVTGETIWDKIGFSQKLVTEYSKNPLQLFSHLLLQRNLATGATMAVRANTIPAFLPFLKLEGYLHDYLLALQGAAGGTLGIINNTLTQYRIHDAQQVGFRKRVVPLYLQPVYKTLVFLKKQVLKRSKKRIMNVLVTHLTNFTDPGFPEASLFLRKIQQEKR